MFYYKIKNFRDRFGQPDYKILDISKNIPGSQCYGDEVAILANLDDKQHKDLEQITEEEYLSLKGEVNKEESKTKEEIENLKKQLETCQQSIAELTALATTNAVITP